MRFLVDESLQRHVAKLHVDNGHNAVHVSDIGLRGAPDETAGWLSDRCCFGGLPR